MSRCKHPRLKEFRFRDGEVIRICPDCCRFDKARRETLHKTGWQPKSRGELEEVIPEGHLGNYLVWKYLSTSEKAETLKRLENYCYKATRIQGLYVPPLAYDLASEEKLPSDIRYKKAREAVTRDTIRLALLRFLASFDVLTPEQQNLKALRHEFGVVSSHVLNAVRDEIKYRTRGKRKEPKIVPLDETTELEDRGERRDPLR